ncbi:unnamed protein product [Mytilus coruscus]|uniref:Endonuclease/exonuclease/phosphatase domain-containing protein n=1 Tax=Mytilus coruscus TaxID=42192 RepID=A0A6J8CAQ4_MYTCO|nr:unnamed protein product [Mytilus coruscus]
MDRLRSTAKLSLVEPTLSCNADVITIVFHNIRSLHLHIQDLKKENNILQSDAIGIAETRLHSADQDEDYELTNFRFIGTTLKQELDQDHTMELLRAIIIYCPPKIASGSYFKLARSIPLGENTVVLGDFNIDAQKADVLYKLFSKLNYIELPTNVITDYQSCLDRIFTNIRNDDLKNGALESYYSDHEPIYLSLPVL